MQKLFNVIKKLVILIPFTADSIRIARGGPMVEQLEILMRTFQKDSNEVAKSIIPVLTKVKPTADDFDFDLFQSDLEEIMKQNLANHLTEMQNQTENVERIKVTEEEIAQYESGENIDQINPEKLTILKEYCDRKQFFDNFVNELIICDPLNRRGDPEKYPAMDHEKVLTVE